MFEKVLDIDSKKLALFTIFSLVSFIVLNSLMGLVRAFPVPTYNIVDFEFSWTGARADQIMNTWGQEVVSQELFITYLDYLYLVSYGSMAFGLLALGTKGVKKSPVLLKVGMIFLIFPYTSAACDAIENVNLIMMLQGFPAAALDVNAFLASVFAFVKFGLLLASLAFFIIELAYILIHAKKR